MYNFVLRIHTHRRAEHDPVSASLHAYSQAIMFTPKTVKGKVDFTVLLTLYIRYRLTNSKYSLSWAGDTHSAATHTCIHKDTHTHTYTHAHINPQTPVAILAGGSNALKTVR